jgi:hypothetical protein
MDLAFDEMYGWLVLGLNFSGAPMILFCKKFLAVNAR